MFPIAFWLIAALTSLVTVSLLLGTLLRPRQPAGADPGARVYRDQFEEVGRDLERGLLSQDEAERLRAEIARRLIDLDRRSAAGPAAAPAPAAGAVPRLALGLAVSLPLLSLALYAWIGVPGYPDLALADRLAMAEASYDSRPGQDEAVAEAPPRPAPTLAPEEARLLDELRAALAKRPDDTEGLTLLAGQEAAIGNFPAAIEAQTRLIAARGAAATAEDHALLGHFMVEAAGGQVSPEAEAVLARALEMDPSNSRATFLIGLMFAQTGRPDRTFDLWLSIQMTEDPSSPLHAIVRDQLPEIAALSGQRYDPPETAGPSAEDMAAAADMSPEDRAAMIESMVSGLESRLADIGGSPEEWQQLITALGVQGDMPRAQKALDKARAAFAGNSAVLTRLDETARAAGLLP